MYKKPKIIVAKIALRIEAFIDINGEYSSANTNCIFDSMYSLCFLGALLNSQLMSFVYKEYFGALIMSGGYFQYQSPQLKTLPIPPISFTTVEKEREMAVEETIKLFSNLKYGDILRWTEQELTRKRNDTIHDFLAYLAEQMIEMNKKKNEEIKGFLKWLEREIGSEIDNLANKTAVKEYHEHNFNQLLEVLKRNRKLLSIDPSERKIQELLENQFTKSLSILKPLKTGIKATDELIDEIVYRLYGLTEDEVKIVEGKT